MTNLSVKAEVANLSEFLNASREVTKKAEELQEVIQRLNAIELKISTEVVNQICKIKLMIQLSIQRVCLYGSYFC